MIGGPGRSEQPTVLLGFVGGPGPLVGVAVPLVGGPLALVGEVVAFVGGSVALVGVAVALVGLQRMVEATRTVVVVDGTGLTLAHEDGVPRWVAVSDAAMELLEQVQYDFGEGPCLLAYAEDRVVAVQDLHGELVWDRLAAVVGQLHVRGVLSVPVRLTGQPVGTLNVYATQPRVWTPGEVEALGALAVVTAELVSTGVDLVNREVAQLRHAQGGRPRPRGRPGGSARADRRSGR